MLSVIHKWRGQGAGRQTSSLAGQPQASSSAGEISQVFGTPGYEAPVSAKGTQTRSPSVPEQTSEQKIPLGS